MEYGFQIQRVIGSAIEEKSNALIQVAVKSPRFSKIICLFSRPFRRNNTTLTKATFFSQVALIGPLLRSTDGEKKIRTVKTSRPARYIQIVEIIFKLYCVLLRRRRVLMGISCGVCWCCIFLKL